MEINKCVSDLLNLEATKVTNISRLHIKNEVFKIDTNKKTVMMKVYLDENKYEKSENEWNVLNKYGGKLNIIPTPILIDRSERYFGGPVIFRDYVEGTELKSEIKKRVAENRDYKSVLQQSLAVIKTIHEMNGKGSIDDFALSSQRKFEKLFKTNTDSLKNDLRKHVRVIDDYIKKRQQLNPNNFSFCHGDLGGHEVILRKNNIPSVIDWENACYFDPACDYGYFTFSVVNSHYKTPERVEEIYSFLKRNANLENLDFFIAERAIGTSSIYYAKERPDKCEWAMNFAEKMLDNL